MSNRSLSVGRVLVAATLAAVLGGSHGRASVPAVATAPSVAQRYYPEVRLRKMHLVRPDLIPYPIDFDVYC